jgi:Peptidase family M48
MRNLKTLPVALALSAMSLAVTAQQPTSPSEVVDKIVAQEHAEVQLLRQYSPLVETYIQYLRPDKQAGAVPNGDKYFLGRAELAKGVVLEPLERGANLKHRLLGGLGEFFSTEFVPRGFLQMIYLDMFGFDRQHYKIEYLRREFLGEVRCLVFDVNPLPKSGKGRFVGRIWVEDQGYHIVRFNGAYGGSSLVSNYFNFDSWRTNTGKNLWLPAFIYSAEGGVNDEKTKNIGYKAFRAQTRLWGYNLGHARQEQELSRVLVEGSTEVRDQSEAANDYSPLQSERFWDRQAVNNVIERLEQQGLLAPYGAVDKVLETVINNLEVTNNLDIQPEVRCRVLMTSTLESFDLGHTIVLSRGLIDVLPDEATLAAILAHELGHVVLGHRLDTQFGFFDSLRFNEKETFRHFDFARAPEQERAANQKATELLSNSPYRESYGNAHLFFQALKERSKQIPNLINPSLGDRVPTNWTIPSAVSSAKSDEKPTPNVVAALPLGGRIKIDPWNNQLRMLKSKPMGTVAESEKMPFRITPLVFYLTRQGDNPSLEAPAAAAAKLPSSTKP